MNEKIFGRVTMEIMANQNAVLCEKNDFIISKAAGTARAFTFDLKHPHIIEGLGLVFCTRGVAKIKVNLETFEVTEKTVLVMLSNYLVEMPEQSEDLQIEFICFSFDFISDIPMQKGLGEIRKIVEEHPVRTIEKDVFSEMLAFHHAIVKQYQTTTVYRIQIIKSLLHTIIYQILSNYSVFETAEAGKKCTRHEVIYKKFLSLLYANYKHERNVKFYADKLCLSPKYFSRLIKKTNGISVTERIDDMVIVAAKAMLKNVELTVAQIACELSFANPSYFGTFFKKKVGLTPIQYRG